ncbi:phage/plasmid replication protein, II/X family [uncultured Psychrobacter sp.]|uniref:phage/plasmid replication protein, II/X family n=1 Tax=uncultured Psychrobacter sp. TaxID=259303 RepID=UPI002612908E|nr:phage/plasmid replication protein, II/X family [uncultured Psychrobacter sp.]
MIDWVTMKMSCDHDGIISNGEVVSLSKDGDSIEWSLVKFLPLVGSHDATISIRSITQSTIEISGNPTKWLQGHNLFGTNDLKRLVWLFFNKLLDIPELKLKPTLEQLHAVKMGKLTVSRVDINETWFLETREEVLAWLRAAGQKISLKHRGAGQFKGDTLYWGNIRSRRWFLKCYSKGDEINSKKSNFPDALRTPEMLAYADRALRIELVLRSNQLREWQLHEVAHWNADTGKMLLLELIKGLEMSNNMRLTDDKLKNLKPSVKMAYFAWLGGQDLKLELKRPTYYRYKAQLKELGIDIGIPRDIEQKDANVIPLMRVLEAQPVGIPDWAFEQGLVVCA